MVFTLDDFNKRGALPRNPKRAKSPDIFESKKKRPKTQGGFVVSEDEDDDVIEILDDGSTVSTVPAQQPPRQRYTSDSMREPSISTTLHKKQVKKLNLSTFLGKKSGMSNPQNSSSITPPRSESFVPPKSLPKGPQAPRFGSVEDATAPRRYVQSGRGQTVRTGTTLENRTRSPSVSIDLGGNPLERSETLPTSTFFPIIGQNQSGYTEYAGIQSKPFPGGSPFQQKTAASNSAEADLVTPKFSQRPNSHVLNQKNGPTNASEIGRKIPGQSSGLLKRKTQPKVPANLAPVVGEQPTITQSSTSNSASRTKAFPSSLTGNTSKEFNFHGSPKPSLRNPSSVSLSTVEQENDVKYDAISSPPRTKQSALKKFGAVPDGPSRSQSIISQASKTGFSPIPSFHRHSPANAGLVSTRTPEQDSRVPKTVRFATTACAAPARLDEDVLDTKIDLAAITPSEQLLRPQKIQDQHVQNLHLQGHTFIQQYQPQALYTQHLRDEQPNAWSTQTPAQHTLDLLQTQELQAQQPHRQQLESRKLKNQKRQIQQLQLPRPSAPELPGLPIPHAPNGPTVYTIDEQPIDLATVLQPLSPDVEPYFEYTILQKLWPASSPEPTTPNSPLTQRPYTSLDDANSVAQRLFAQTCREYEITFEVRFSASSCTRGPHDCAEHIGTFSPLDYTSKKTHLKICVQRAFVSRLANTSPIDLHPTQFISSTIYLLRLFKLPDAAPPSDPEIKIEEEQDREPALPQRNFVGLPCTEVYTTAHAANRAACRLQIDLSHEEEPKEGSWGDEWQVKDRKRLWEVLRRLNEEGGEDEGLWSEKFNGKGKSAGRYEVCVEKGGLAGPRNL